MKFEIYKRNDGDFGVRLKAVNGEIICWTEGYTSKQNAQNAIAIIKQTTYSTSVIDLT